MISSDYGTFIASLATLAKVYGKTLDDEQVKFYWNALQDRPLADVEHRMSDYAKKGKFFPKPRDLRPFEGDADVQGKKNIEEDGPYQDALKWNKRGWAEKLAANPAETKLELAEALWARYNLSGMDIEPEWQDNRNWLRGRIEELRREVSTKSMTAKRVSVHVFGENR